MAGLYRNLLLLSLAMYVVCMLVSLADAAPIENRSIRGNQGGRRSGGRPRGLEEGVEEFDGALRKRRGIRGGARGRWSGRRQGAADDVEESDGGDQHGGGFGRGGSR